MVTRKSVKLPANEDTRYATDWCDLLRDYMISLKLTARELARMLRTKHQLISYYLSGRSKVPLALLPRLTEALNLNAKQAAEFQWLALEAYTPAVVWARIVDLEKRIAALEAQA